MSEEKRPKDGEQPNESPKTSDDSESDFFLGDQEHDGWSEIVKRPPSRDE